MVAVQVRDVPASVREVLNEEAARRGESLQVYLLEVLTREAATPRNRRLAVDWSTVPLVDVSVVVNSAALVRESREARD